ncbi:YfcL family protein [Ferrimonas sediminicola]|uniref:YfcL family protein n=1 Tax=Ferrimonas sediminicola TaxID=2569538 RepID=A0A4U1BF25_9GAMM|nr:YfcL family protein [Ferrimonas sediminicola]TKB49844.1 YfcL family protein [Ferrimonas sediminicola]
MLEQIEQQANQWMTEMVEQGSDDQVFASGYLQGHLALSLSTLEESGGELLSCLAQDMLVRLDEASSELAPEDLALVHNAWQQLLSRLQQH